MTVQSVSRGTSEYLEKLAGVRVYVGSGVLHNSARPNRLGRVLGEPMTPSRRLCMSRYELRRLRAE